MPFKERRWLGTVAALCLTGCGAITLEKGTIHATQKLAKGHVLQTSDLRHIHGALEVFHYLNDVQTVRFAVGKTLAKDVEKDQGLTYDDLDLSKKKDSQGELDDTHAESVQRILIAACDLGAEKTIEKKDLLEITVHDDLVPEEYLMTQKDLIGSVTHRPIEKGRMFLKSIMHKHRSSVSQVAYVTQDIPEASIILPNSVTNTHSSTIEPEFITDVTDCEGWSIKYGITQGQIMRTHDLSPITEHLLNPSHEANN